jgi:hypothetical protein
MATYTEMILRDLKAAGWDASSRQIRGERYVATARKAGHLCAAEDDGELGALTKLLQSVREIEAGRLFAAGQVIRVREHLGDLEPGHYLIRAVDADGLVVSPVGEDRASGDLCASDQQQRLPMHLTCNVIRTYLQVDTP